MDQLQILKEKACQVIDDERDWAVQISHDLFVHPEFSDCEYYASQYLVGRMQEKGFSTELPYAGVATAFRCAAGQKGGKTVAFLAEYDALPGYGENHQQLAHACGHNWISASTALAAAGVAKVMDFPGEVLLIGTPGEEASGRKIDMDRHGAFDGLDGVFQMHLAKDNSVDTVTLALTTLVFEFSGKAAHAAGCPELGINALDACHLTLSAINAMRQQLAPEVKIHAVYLDGGMKPSIIPDHASLNIYVRDKDVASLEKLVERVLNIGRGAELMTGAKFSYTRAENTYYDLRNDERMKGLMKKHLEQVGITEFAPSDIYHGISSDIGNVSYRCPTSYCNMGTSHLGEAEIHAEEFLKIADSEGAHELLVKAAKAMAMSALEVLFPDNK